MAGVCLGGGGNTTVRLLWLHLVHPPSSPPKKSSRDPLKCLVVGAMSRLSGWYEATFYHALRRGRQTTPAKS